MPTLNVLKVYFGAKAYSKLLLGTAVKQLIKAIKQFHQFIKNIYTTIVQISLKYLFEILKHTLMSVVWHNCWSLPVKTDLFPFGFFSSAKCVLSPLFACDVVYLMQLRWRNDHNSLNVEQFHISCSENRRRKIKGMSLGKVTFTPAAGEEGRSRVASLQLVVSLLSWSAKICCFQCLQHQ